MIEGKFMGQPGAHIFDHETGKMIGAFDENGYLDTADVVENLAGDKLEKIASKYVECHYISLTTVNEMIGVYCNVTNYDFYSGDGKLLYSVEADYDDFTCITYLPYGTYTICSRLNDEVIATVTDCLIDQENYDIFISYFPEEDYGEEEDYGGDGEGDGM